MKQVNHIPANIKAWPMQEAVGVKKHLSSINESKDKITFQTGYGPSGLPHIGTFGEVMRTSMVRHSFEKLYEVKTNLLCFSDDLDGLRKVPDNIPQKKLLEENLKKEALEKYGVEEGSGKNLPFSSLSDDLKKKKKNK